jgi:hypothetical protein
MLVDPATARGEEGLHNGGTRSLRRTTALRPDLALSVGVSDTVDGSVLLSASAADLGFRKIVHSDGSFHVQVDHGHDRLALAGFEGRLSLTYGSRSLVLATSRSRDEDWRGVRELMLATPAGRLFRRLTAELEAASDVEPEVLGLRATGALLGELDGDDGAVRRLSRELLNRQASDEARVGAAHRLPLTVFLHNTLDASAELERRLVQAGVWGVNRIGPQLAWVLHVEAVWFAFYKERIESGRAMPSAWQARGGTSC